ncbi:flagellar hook capping protein (plasmid) [Burkholderia ubonensis]|uniref:Basal-body rod modification protein FlgD n=1 Tax=Burkholderia ubonensis TaxID=101571 RepID=A0A103RNH1_9BURK|nr:flagellar hook capping FlgD N-terminal domain-containing protein [Burkholderia ubonensis]AOJ64582.1 flagellar hook capping protein [Burkholderia ubonensis]KVG71126.1 flagellar hook capping protein [Burkholderia ubonensis]
MATTNPISSSVQNTTGLDMQSLLKIILTQLTFQDPLKPMDNFQFVSQLAEFASLQQSAQISDKLDSLLSVQGTTQGVSLLSHKVDVNTDGGKTVSGTVQSITFNSGIPVLTVQTSDGTVLTDISMSQIKQVR